MIIPPDGSSLTYSGAISDDHEWVVFSSWNSTNTFVYKLENETYTLKQIIKTSSKVRHLAMSPDHLFLILGTIGPLVCVYKHDGIQFNLSPQMLNYFYSSPKFVSITNDHQFLTVSEMNSEKVYRYYFNSTSDEF